VAVVARHDRADDAVAVDRHQEELALDLALAGDVAARVVPRPHESGAAPERDHGPLVAVGEWANLHEGAHSTPRERA